MDVIFNCPHCQQELAVDANEAGSERECPACGQMLAIPALSAADAALAANPITTSAEAKVERHFKVPVRDKPSESLIAKPLPPLETAAKEAIKLKLKTFKRSECVEVGKDHFDEVVSKFLEKVGEANVIAAHPITYSHQDMATRSWIADYGIIVLYKG